MSSFHKAIDSGASITGTKVKNNTLVISSGIPSLDHIIGGGLPLGSIFMVEEDILGNYSRVLSKYFLAEGVVCKHNIFVASADDEPREIVKELPVPCNNPPDDEVSITTAAVDKMKIAWRYEGLGQVESSFGCNATFGHHFDLSKHVHPDVIESCNITYWNNSDLHKDGESSFNNRSYHYLLSSIQNEVSKNENQGGTRKDNNVLRINIQSLGSPVWTAEVDDASSVWSQDLIKFMYCLRVIIRDTNAIAFITMPTHLFDEASTTNRLLYSIDNATKLESFAGSSRETNPVFKDYHGLFHITKLSAINSLVQYVPPSLDMAFKLRRKKFNIEKLHLPPELQESSEREQDDIVTDPATMSCGGFKKKDIDF